jgi:mRNA interferase MazF
MADVRGVRHAEKNREEQKGMTVPRRGDIYLVEFDPARGHEIQKTRPAVVIQNDVSNQHSPITIIAAISSQFRDPPYPREVLIRPGGRTGLNQPSAVILNQIRSIDHERLVKRLGALDAVAMRRVDDALKISLGLVEI